jgi:hypothetical protein
VVSVMNHVLYFLTRIAHMFQKQTPDDNRHLT